MGWRSRARDQMAKTRMHWGKILVEYERKTARKGVFLRTGGKDTVIMRR